MKASLPITKVDVLIVGSGPTGSSIALHLIQRDPTWAQRLLVVDKAIHPRDKLCGGGITHYGYDILTDLGLEFKPNHFAVREAKLVYQDQSYSFHGNPVFRIVRRREFDHWLVQEVEQRGGVISQGEGVKDVKVLTTHVEVTTDQRVIHAQVLVAADGSRSFIRSRLKWGDKSRVARLLEVDTAEDPVSSPEFSGRTAIFDFSNMLDGLQGYYWDFPSYVDGEPIMNRGVFDSRAVPSKPKADLKATLRRMLARRERKLDDYQLKGHPIRWFDYRDSFSKPRVLLAGDAAGVDPLVGEGISFALAYGLPVTDALEDAFARHDFSFENYKKQLSRYWLFKQLRLRTSVARFAYWINSPRFIRLGWQVTKRIIALTPWRNPNYVPGKNSQ